MKKIIFALIAGVGFASCELTNVLDQEPPHNMTPGQVVKDEKSAELALTGVYGNLVNYDAYALIGNQALTSGILMANKMPGEGGNNIYYSERNLPRLKYADAFAEPFWNSYTTVINSANLLIRTLEQLDDDQFSGGRKLTMEGELRFLRAFSNFEMLRYFGEYDRLDSRFGLILRSKPATANDILVARSTVRQAYDFILEDIEYALEKAPDFKTAAYASKMAARALKVKVLFYMGDYAGALSAADQFIAAGERTLEGVYKNIFTKFDNSELIFVRAFASPDYIRQNTRVQAYNNEGKWGPTPYFLNLAAGDARENVILKDGVGDKFKAFKTIAKASDETGAMPVYYLRYSEIYMIKAECEARGGRPDKALATLNAMRTAHGLPVITTADVQGEIMDILLKEWILEMGFETGHEWYAIWRQDVDKLLEINETLKADFDLALDQEGLRASYKSKRIYGIPKAEISGNKLAEQNPGYN